MGIGGSCHCWIRCRTCLGETTFICCCTNRSGTCHHIYRSTWIQHCRCKDSSCFSTSNELSSRSIQECRWSGCCSSSNGEWNVIDGNAIWQFELWWSRRRWCRSSSCARTRNSGSSSTWTCSICHFSSTSTTTSFCHSTPSNSFCNSIYICNSTSTLCNDSTSNPPCSAFISVSTSSGSTTTVATATSYTCLSTCTWIHCIATSASTDVWIAISATATAPTTTAAAAAPTAAATTARSRSGPTVQLLPRST